MGLLVHLEQQGAVAAGSAGILVDAWRRMGEGRAAAPVQLALQDGRSLTLLGFRPLPAGGYLVTAEVANQEGGAAHQPLRCEGLTGLANRFGFGERLAETLAGRHLDLIVGATGRCSGFDAAPLAG